MAAICRRRPGFAPASGRTMNRWWRWSSRAGAPCRCQGDPVGARRANPRPTRNSNDGVQPQPTHGALVGRVLPASRPWTSRSVPADALRRRAHDGELDSSGRSSSRAGVRLPRANMQARPYSTRSLRVRRPSRDARSDGRKRPRAARPASARSPESRRHSSVHLHRSAGIGGEHCDRGRPCDKVDRHAPDAASRQKLGKHPVAEPAQNLARRAAHDLSDPARSEARQGAPAVHALVRCKHERVDRGYRRARDDDIPPVVSLRGHWPSCSAISIGTIFMALHAAQGPRLGVPQMVQSRGQFGAKGAAFVVALVAFMYVGYAGTAFVTGGQSLHSDRALASASTRRSSPSARSASCGRFTDTT